MSAFVGFFINLAVMQGIKHIKTVTLCLCFLQHPSDNSESHLQSLCCKTVSFHLQSPAVKKSENFTSPVTVRFHSKMLRHGGS
jgi:hypothetical protein